MEYLKEKEIADVKLIDVEVSEDELDVYQRCLSYILKYVDPKQTEAEFGATKEELWGMLESMEDVMNQAGVLRDDEEVEVALLEAEK